MSGARGDQATTPQIGREAASEIRRQRPTKSRDEIELLASDCEENWDRYMAILPKRKDMQ